MAKTIYIALTDGQRYLTVDGDLILWENLLETMRDADKPKARRGLLTQDEAPAIQSQEHPQAVTA